MASPRLITAAEAALDDLGDVKGPGPVTDGNIALFDGTTGTLLKAAGVVEGVAIIDSTTNVLIGDGAGNAIDSGSAIGDLGSLLTLNTARVDASGSDETGTIGNLSKPFLTVQATIDAIIALAAGESPPDYVVIDIGANAFGEVLTIAFGELSRLPILIFKGVNSNGISGADGNSRTWSTLTISGGGNQLDIRLKDCKCGGISTDSPLVLLLDNANLDGNTIDCSYSGNNGLVVGSMYGTGAFPGLITADDTDIIVFGISPDAPGGTTIQTANGDVRMSSCGQAPGGRDDGSYEQSLFNVSAANGDVQVNDSLLAAVAANSLILVRSKVIAVPSISGTPPNFIDDQGPFAYNYDFDISGGGQGNKFLGYPPGSQGVALPTGFVVTGAILEIITPLDSASHLATVALSSGESAGDLQAATLVSGAPWSTTGLKNLTHLFKITGAGFAGNPLIVVAVEDLTAGEFTLHIEGYLAP